MNKEVHKELSIFQLRLFRPEEGGELPPWIQGSQGQNLRQVLSQPPSDLVNQQLALGQASGLLPSSDSLPADKKRKMRGLWHPKLVLVASAYKAALTHARTIPGWNPPATLRITQAHSRLSLSERLRRTTMESLHSALDQRLLVGAFASFVVDKVTLSVRKVLANPELAVSERARIQNAFGRLLTHGERTIRAAKETRAENQKIANEAEALAQRHSEDQLLREVTTAVRRKEVITKDKLHEAAMIWDRREQENKNNQAELDPEATKQKNKQARKAKR